MKKVAVLLDFIQMREGGPAQIFVTFSKVLFWFYCDIQKMKQICETLAKHREHTQFEVTI